MWHNQSHAAQMVKDGTNGNVWQDPVGLLAAGSPPPQHQRLQRAVPPVRQLRVPRRRGKDALRAKGEADLQPLRHPCGNQVGMKGTGT